jgi:hypothetical protein
MGNGRGIKHSIKSRKALLLTTAVLAGIVGIGVPSATETAQAATTPTCTAIANPSGPAWCIWSGTGGTGSQEAIGQSTVLDLDNYYIRNLDKSVEDAVGANGGKMYLRLYYSLNLKGSWVCLDPGTFLYDTFYYNFNNAPSQPGYGQSIYDNVASLSWTSSACGNPIVP